MAVDNIQCPFQPGIMITAPEKFWGRVYEKTKIIARIKNMESSAIIGSRRIGKSSLAYIVYTFCKSNLSTCESVWIDCQDVNILTVDGLFRQINASGSLNYVSGKTKKECLENFTQAIKSSNKKFVVFFDEFELLTNTKHKREFNESFYMQLRMLAGRGGNLALITVSKEPLQDICKHILDISSPFYNIFTPFPLSFFSEGDTKKFIHSQHDGFKFSRNEAALIKRIEDYRHPLVLQIASEAIYVNRFVKDSNEVLTKKILEQKMNYLNHEEVQVEREKEKIMASKKKEPTQISKPLDLLISILIPILGIGAIVFEFGWLIQKLTNFQAVLLAIFSVLVGFAVLIFAGRSINIIGETTFFKLFVRIIEQIPLFSNILNTITNATKNFRR